MSIKPISSASRGFGAGLAAALILVWIIDATGLGQTPGGTSRLPQPQSDPPGRPVQSADPIVPSRAELSDAGRSDAGQSDAGQSEATRPAVIGAVDSVLTNPTALAHPAAAQSPTPDPQHRVGAAGELIGFSHADGSGTQTITLVHSGKSWMAVYHVDRTGVIRLTSSRPIDADFSLQLNATEPLPDQIRQMRNQSRSGAGR